MDRGQISLTQAAVAIAAVAALVGAGYYFTSAPSPTPGPAVYDGSPAVLSDNTSYTRDTTTSDCRGGDFDYDGDLDYRDLNGLESLLESVQTDGTPGDYEVACADVDNDGRITAEDGDCLFGLLNGAYRSTEDCSGCRADSDFEICHDGKDNDCDGQTDRDTYGGVDLCDCNVYSPCEMYYDVDGVAGSASGADKQWCRNMHDGRAYRWVNSSEISQFCDEQSDIGSSFLCGQREVICTDSIKLSLGSVEDCVSQCIQSGTQPETCMQGCGVTGLILPREGECMPQCMQTKNDSDICLAECGADDLGACMSGCVEGGDEFPDCRGKCGMAQIYIVKLLKEGWREVINKRILRVMETEEYVYVVTVLEDDEVESIERNEKVVSLLISKSEEAAIPMVRQELANEVDESARMLGMGSLLAEKALPPKEEVDEYLSEQRPEVTGAPAGPPEIMASPHQAYVTPTSQLVADLASTFNSTEAAYKEAVSWLWVSDKDLNGVNDLWFYPNLFLHETPNLTRNPTPGFPVSDCEDQSHAFVSLLRSMGVSEEHVRAVYGVVTWVGYHGEHVWVEIFDNGYWMPLDPNSGPQYRGTLTKQVVASPGWPYDYYKLHEYPYENVYYYYNDRYFYDMTTGEGNAPPLWLEAPNYTDIINETLFGTPSAPFSK